MRPLSPKLSWSALIELANAHHGYQRFKLNYFIYELDSYRSNYLYLYTPSLISKQTFIDYVLYDDEYESTCSYVDEYLY